jgi:DNA repair protein RadC
LAKVDGMPVETTPRMRDPMACCTPARELRPPLKPQERPREKMMLFGKTALSDVELVALVLGGGRSIARGLSLLEGFGGLAGLEAAEPHELCAAPGVGQAGAAALCAAFELGRRLQQLSLPHATSVRSPRDVSAFVRAMLGPSAQEVFVILGLDARQRVRMVRTVAVGTLSQVDVHPREVFRPLVRAAMHSVIVVHNHPSGEAEPSTADVELTHRLADVGRLVGIPLLDHLVVTRKDMVSLATLGLLPGP